MKIFFSVIIPVYNAEKTLSKTLNSLLAQTCTDYELILINDCSTDKSSIIIEQYKDKFNNIIIINNTTNIGPANSRNKGAELSNGKYIAFLDSDDIWVNIKLEKQKQFINKTNCDLCCTSYGFIDNFDNTIKRNYTIPEKITYNMLLKENFVGCSSVAIKKELFLENKMNSSYFHEDYALWLNLTRNNYCIMGIIDVLMYYRITTNNKSYNKFKTAKHRYDIYRNQEKLNPLKSLHYMIYYTINGIKKKLL